MTRNEMIDRLANLIARECANGYYDHFDVANMILGVVERAGMKPPIEKLCPVTMTKTYTWEKERA